jgi:large subunit ribosomal protein L25
MNMEKASLTATTRELGKAKTNGLRIMGQIPAILYGREHKPVTIAVDGKSIHKVLSTKAGLNILIDLDIAGKEKVMARVCDYQAHPLTREFTHIDFQIVDLKRKIEVEVPLHFEGKSPGIKEGGVMDIQRRSLSVKCLPTAIPEFIAVDISALNIGDNIHMNDLKLPEGVECPHDQNFVIVAVVPPAKEEEVVAAPVEGEAAAAGAAAPGAPGAAAPGGAPAAGDKKAAAPAAGAEKKPAGK